MDPKKDNKQTGGDKAKEASTTPDTSGKEPDLSGEDISPDPILAEKDEVKIAEEKLRSKTNKK